MGSDGWTAGWDAHGSRSFWTRRRKAAASLVTVMALLGGLAVAFSVFDRTIGNNVVRDAASFNYEVWKRDTAAGEHRFVNTAGGRSIFESGQAQYPGDTRTVEVKIRNTNIPARDATFELWMDPTAIRVTRCSDVGADGSLDNDFNQDGTCAGTVVGVSRATDPQRWERFVGYWTFHVTKQAILEPIPDDIVEAEVNESAHTEDNALTPGSEDEPGDPDDTRRPNYLPACEGGLEEFSKGAPCVLGNVEGSGSNDALGEANDVRYFEFNLTQENADEDQSEFRGWAVVFDMVFQAHVPARPETTIEH